MFNTVQEVYDFIDAQNDRVYALDGFKKYMNLVGNPQNQLKCIHIGGTNGKGSTTNFIREALQLSNYKVGTFTSPFLEKPQDQIRINNEFISDDFIINMANKHMNDWLKAEISKFEIEVYICIMYFIENHIDYAVFEVGLGGEFDATNIINPLVCVNTNIGMDHMNFLGNTIESIAKTKAGIVKNGIDYITGETKQQCLDIFKDVCKYNNSNLIQVQNIMNIKADHYVSFCYRQINFELNTLALYQAKNAALAVEVLLYLKDRNLISIDIATIQQALKQAVWKGRFEIIRKDPLIIIDGAHNNDGIDALVNTIKNYDNLLIIFSALKDKSTDEMMKKLLKVTNNIIVTQFDFYRAQKATILANGFDVKVEENFKDAIEIGLKHNGPLVITGSLYFIAQVRKYLVEKGESTG